MLTSIRKLLQRYGIETEQSVYQNMQEAVMDYALTIGDFIEVCDGEKAWEHYQVLQRCRQFVSDREQSEEKFCACTKRVEEIGKLFSEIKRHKKQEISITKEEERKLKQERKELRKSLEDIEGQIEMEACQTFGYDWRRMQCLQYKNIAYLTSFDDLSQVLPKIRDVQIKNIREIPLFVSNLGGIEKALACGEGIGIVGGPCLFGIDEVLIHIELLDGESVSFDCSCGRRCLRETRVDVNLEEYVNLHSQEIVGAAIENRKSGITRQEYDSIAYLFAFADQLRAKAVIPLPDMSYFKYAQSDLKGLSDKLREQTLLEFARECYKITDMYLEVIERIARKYPKVEYTVVHHRDEALCREFYEKREQYITNSAYMRKITNISGKKDSIIDYITMLALPYYIYGTRNIVQLDSVDETDSGRKCSKIHKGDISLTQILYPEYLSGDGEHTIYNAPLEYKEYISVSQI